jgi:DNA-directed RNA polymerase subunit RPC12/RpoP
MFGFFEKKKEKNYFCTDCQEHFDDKYLKAKNIENVQCPFCKSLKCYEIQGKVTKKDTNSSK